MTKEEPRQKENRLNLSSSDVERLKEVIRKAEERGHYIQEATRLSPKDLEKSISARL